MKDKRMIIALKPRSMGELAGWNLFLSEYLQQGLSGGGDFQITMGYKEGDGLTMQLVKRDKKLREMHIRKEPLEVAAKTLQHAAKFTLASQRRNENPIILLAQDTGVSKDTIEEDKKGERNMEEKICAFVKKEDLVERAKSVIRCYEKRRQNIEKEMEAIDKKGVLTEEELNRGKELAFNLMNNRNELGAVIEAIVLMDVMESAEIAEYLASPSEETDDQREDT